MENLIQLTERLEEVYKSSHRYEVLSERISLTDAGYLDTGKNTFHVPFDSLDQLAERVNIPKHFFRRLPPDIQSVLFNRCWQMSLSDGDIPRQIQVCLDTGMRVTGFDDPQLLRISPLKLVKAIRSSLPQELSPEKIGVARCDSTPQRLWLSCFSPEIEDQPRPGDIINGGIDVVHYLSGNAGTQVSCYLRRLQCTNGSVIHVCREDQRLRARRLVNGRFDEADMLRQVLSLLRQAWAQLPEKLEALKNLLHKDQMPIEYIRQQRTRFSLNDRMLNAIERALHEDELAPTGSQYDIFNAISRVATRDEDLTFRQRRTLSRMAGEFSQQTAHRCLHCGQWVLDQAGTQGHNSVGQEPHGPEYN